MATKNKSTRGEEIASRVAELTPAERIGHDNYLEISDEQLDDFKKRVNGIIHELVFCAQHMDQGDIEETQNCMITAHFSLDSVAADYEKLRAAKFPNT